MNFSIEKKYILKVLKIVERISSLRGMNPILSNILFEATEDNKLILTATDLDLSVETKTVASVSESGKITLPTKKITDIINRLPDKPIVFKSDIENGNFCCEISCSRSKFEVYGISASDFPAVFKDLDLTDSIEFETEPFVKCITHTVFASASYETRNIISGVCLTVSNEKIEMAATDGNRLCRCIKDVSASVEKAMRIVIPSKTMNELGRIFSITEDKKFQMKIANNKIIFISDSFMLSSSLLDGEYPPYTQLIPTSGLKNAVINKQNLINSLELVSTMVNDKTSIVKFSFSNNQLNLEAETPNAGKSEDCIEIEYSEEPLQIAFNYRYILETLKIMENDNVVFALGGAVSAAILKSFEDDSFICIVMPIQLR